MRDGLSIRVADPGAERVEWELPLTGLSEAEWTAIEDLFAESEGALKSFHFVDPMDNLLAWSEDFTQQVWVKDPMLALTPGVADPLGTTRATLVNNNGAAAQRVQQVLSAPGGFHYAWSVQVRSAGAGQVRLLASAGAASQSGIQAVGSDWRRVHLSVKLSSQAESIAFGIELDAGASVEVFGAQVEAQVAPQAYKLTGARSAVYSQARFASDVLPLVSGLAGDHSGAIRITASLG
jgi:hypothetical protein